jgi:RNA polymerase sigma-70 factor (ECF subfamily)
MSLKTIGTEFKTTKSEKSFQVLYNRIAPGLKRYINQIVKDTDTTEDLFSMVMTVVYNKIDQYNPQYHISTWIYRIAYTHAMMHLRNTKRAATTNFSVFDSYYENDRMTDKIMYTQIENDHFEDDFQTLDEKEQEIENTVNTIHEAIDSLDPLYKEIVKDRLVLDMKYGDIAKKHKLPLHTIKNRISRGKRILQNSLKNYR